MRAGAVASADKANFKRSAGFTIVETMIVLGVTGALFVIIAASLSGRQNAAQFTHAIQSVQSQLQQTIDQVPDGFFPDQGLSCTNAGGAPQFNTGGSQGSNDQCVFLGKAIQFQVHGTDPEAYQIYTVAGLRCKTCTVGATSPFQNVAPTVVGVNADYTTYSVQRTLQYGLTTAWMRSDKNLSCTAVACSIGAVAFLMEPGNADTASASGFGAGAQQVDAIPLVGTRLNQDINTEVTAVHQALRDVNLSTDAPIPTQNGVQICFVSAGTNQSGLITIGNSNRQLLVKLDIKSNKTCS